MNVDRIINMIINQIVRRAINAGMNFSFGKLGAKGKQRQNPQKNQRDRQPQDYQE